MELSEKQKIFQKWEDDYESGSGDNEPEAWFESHRFEIHQELLRAGYVGTVSDDLEEMLIYYGTS